MPSLRETILQRVEAVARSVPGMAPASVSRERAAPHASDECPALDVAPEGDDPRPVGAGLDAHELTIRLRVFTAGDGASALADPFIEAFHAALFADPVLAQAVAGIQLGSADFDRDDADVTVGRTTQRYRITYHTRRASLAG